MAKLVDLKALRQVTQDSIRVREAILRAEALTNEGEGMLAKAETLLRQAGLAYLSEEITVAPFQADTIPSAPEEMVSAYVDIQQSYADLKDGLYRLGKAHLESKNWKDVRSVLEALAQMEPGYRDIAELLRETTRGLAEDYFAAQDWEKGADELEDLITATLKNKDDKMEVCTIYIREAKTHPLGALDLLQSLAKREPRIITLDNYPSAVDYATNVRNDQYYSSYAPYLPGVLANLEMDIVTLLMKKR